MRTAANFLWFILNGLWMGLGWWFFGMIAAITIVGLPGPEPVLSSGKWPSFLRQRSHQPSRPYRPR
jgi:uncharacterized membrane protein YccF (DUF307 family)